ncbi:MAG TPA: fumarylacetoacetate hydrolase family protein [Pusillimonas sp.]|uniref:fumarylacetoacetate hydrolase family protein n=1 Tax=unclassified Pusillimonas TaxID=2640016 RepID=UPI00260501A4|nr:MULTISPECIES: fumarylacetoacetate hydrolase family protein [unclassified Pusillimonas]HLU19372.1 fumarylacetoacetate hydrolase family protein [Pusillimonas sp.]
MKYQLFTYLGADGEARPGMAVDGGLYDLPAVLGVHATRWRSVDDMLADWAQARQRLAALATELAEESTRPAGAAISNPTYLPPLTRCGVVYAAGANYRDHVEAMARAMNMKLVTDPKAEGIAPWHFIKAGQATLSAHQQNVCMPADTAKLDWEAELAVIIGKKAEKVEIEDALDYVAGYSCANDLSARDHLNRQAVDASSPFKFDWIGHKCFTGACPLGPFITPAEFVDTPENLGIKLWLNDEIKQNSNTNNHLYSVAEQISYLSKRLSLLPGDILLTGTPAGVGMESGVFLQRGDVMRVWIEGLGELETRIV